MTQTVEYVTKYMTKDLITFSPDTDIRVATKTLLQNKISGAPVVRADGKLIGVLSEKDCISTLLDGAFNQRPSGNGTVADYMSTDIKTIPSHKTIMDVAVEFVNTPFRRFPVVEGGRLVGQISRRDVLRAIVKRKPTINHKPSSWKVREPISK